MLILFLIFFLLLFFPIPDVSVRAATATLSQGIEKVL